MKTLNWLDAAGLVLAAHLVDFRSEGEGDMKTFLNTSVAFAILLAGPVMTYPAASVSAPVIHWAHPHHKAVFADAKALAPLSATPAAAARSSARQTDGLSRNPEDCAKYGYIDEGGD